MDQQRQLISHLLRRAGFGTTPSELDQYVQLGYDGAVDRLINYDQVADNYPAYDASEDSAKGRKGVGELQLWWLNRMLTTPRPLQEKMTLFWHGHFATAVSKVNQIRWLYNQNQLFRSNALGPFQTMLGNVSKDPAMMFWLDSQTNRKGSPNENYGREVMELFTMGIGTYTEQDVKEGARALTGWTVKRTDDSSTFVPGRFDDGVKNYLGHQGNLGLDDVVSILAGSSNTANFLGRKLARFLISDAPDDGTVWRHREQLCIQRRGHEDGDAHRAHDGCFQGSGHLHEQDHQPGGVRRNEPQAAGREVSRSERAWRAAVDGPGAIQPAQRRRVAGQPFLAQHRHDFHAAEFRRSDRVKSKDRRTHVCRPGCTAERRR